MGAHVGLHPDNLSGKFKNKVTILFHDYILRLRIYRPAGFLFETDQNIKNFFFWGKSVSLKRKSFQARNFKRVMGMSPRMFGKLNPDLQKDLLNTVLRHIHVL